MFGVKTLLIDAMARLVQNAEKGVVETPWIVTRRDAAIARTHAATKGMGGDIEPAGLKAEADLRGDRLPKFLLPIHRVVPLQKLPRGLAA